MTQPSQNLVYVGTYTSRGAEGIYAYRYDPTAGTLAPLGVTTGILIALAQSYASVGALKLAWAKPYFYWVWGGGIFFRILVFAATAFVVYRFSSLSLVATLVSLVAATTLFLVIESAVLLRKG